MLRLISIIGIAIAMVIGFVAISTKMKDDYNVRSRVVDVLKQMKGVALEELQCGASNSAVEAPQSAETSDRTMTEMSSDLEITPLVDDAGQNSQSRSSANSTERLSQQELSESSSQITTSDDNVSEEESAQDSMESVNLEQNSDIVQTMGYQVLDDAKVEVITVFNNVKGDSGKVHIKSQSRLVIHCSCVADEISCETVASNINKNYLPKKLTKQ